MAPNTQINIVINGGQTADNFGGFDGKMLVLFLIPVLFWIFFQSYM